MTGEGCKLAWDRKDNIAVLGSARKYTEQQVILAFRVGREIGRLGRNLITGATSGLPYAAALGAKSTGAIVVGISPARNIDEHVSVYRKPLMQADVLVFTGMGPDGRSPIILRSCRGAVFIGGEIGTLGEFCSAWMCGNNVLGVLEGGGGIADSIQDVLSGIETTWGSQMIFDSEPEGIVRRVCDALVAAPDPADRPEDPGGDVRKTLLQYISQEGERP